MKGNYNFITLLKLCLDEDLHVFTVRLLPLNFLIPCSLLTTWCDLPVSVLLCCKLILQSCKTSCTQTFLDSSQIPFNNPSWGTMSWRPWSLLAFSENLDSLGNTVYVQLVSSFWCCRWYEYTSQMYLPTIKPHWTDGCTGGQPWTEEENPVPSCCTSNTVITCWGSPGHSKGKTSVHFHHRGPCSVQT